MARIPHRNELGEYLKARRAELTPDDVGLPENPRPRRVAGLRREEVARLAAVSADYYTRLEQGRVRASRSVLADLARVLRLTRCQRAELFALADEHGTRPPYPRARQKVQPRLSRLLEDLDGTPALVMGRRTDILAWNPLAAALITDFERIPEKHRTYIRLLFTDPAMRTLFPDWRNVARMAVGNLRTEAARAQDDPRMSALVGDLSTRDECFRVGWAAPVVVGQGAGTMRLHHPVVGALVLDWETLTSAADSEQRLVIWTAEPGSPSEDRLSMLASWAADPVVR
jgi:transcriptional regulator with XRE-family HTH domain